MNTVRLVIAAAVFAAFAAGARVAPVADRVGLSTPVFAALPEGAPAQETATAKDASGEAHEAGSGWGATIAKTVNFAILVGVLVYFLRSPVAAYLTARIAKVREDLVTAQ